jgi:hypothetical protein
LSVHSATPKNGATEAPVTQEALISQSKARDDGELVQRMSLSSMGEDATKAGPGTSSVSAGLEEKREESGSRPERELLREH